MRTAAHGAAEMKIHRRYRTVQGELTERARRLFVASEAMAFGYGGIAAACRAIGKIPNTNEWTQLSCTFRGIRTSFIRTSW